MAFRPQTPAPSSWPIPNVTSRPSALTRTSPATRITARIRFGIPREPGRSAYTLRAARSHRHPVLRATIQGILAQNRSKNGNLVKARDRALHPHSPRSCPTTTIFWSAAVCTARPPSPSCDMAHLDIASGKSKHGRPLSNGGSTVNPKPRPVLPFTPPTGARDRPTSMTKKLSRRSRRRTACARSA